MTRRVRCRVLIVGGGVAGLQAAEVATQFVDEVVLVDKGKAGTAPSSLACASTVAAYLGEEIGGLTTPYFNRARAALQPPVPEERLAAVRRAYRDYAREIVEAGGRLSDPRLVELTVDGVYNRIGWMEAYGLHWERTPESAFLGISAPGHSAPRVAVLREGAAAAMEVLRQGTLNLDGRILDGVWITRLLAGQGRIQGAYGIDLQSGEPVVFETGCVVLTCGGGDRLYADLPGGSSGDGYLLALDAGAQLANLEFARFLPEPELSRADTPKEMGLFLLGLGLPLLNSRGEIVWKENGSPAALVQALHRELATGPVISPFPQEARDRAATLPLLRPFAERAGSELRWRVGFGGLLGGVVHQLFETRVPGLFVAGETSTGCLGADALPGVATSYTLCSAEEAAIRAARQSVKVEATALDESQVAREGERLSASLSGGKAGRGDSLRDIEARLRRLMWEGAGPVRDAEGLTRTLEGLSAIEEELRGVRVATVRELPGLLEVKNLVRVGTMICQAALEREESRGQHVRRDYPAMDDREGRRWITFSDGPDSHRVGRLEITGGSHERS